MRYIQAILLIGTIGLCACGSGESPRNEIDFDVKELEDRLTLPSEEVEEHATVQPDTSLLEIGETDTEQSDTSLLEAEAPVREQPDTSLFLSERQSLDSPVIAVVVTDGTVIPIARLNEAGEWTNPWTQPVYDEPLTERPDLHVPRQWHYHARDGQQAMSLNLKSLVVVDAHCGENWAFSSDLEGQHKSLYGPDRMAGVAFTSAQERVILEPDTSQEMKFRTIFEKLGLVSNDIDGESYYRYVILGYYRWSDVTIAVGFSVGYEGESYHIIEISDETGRVALKVYGGGC